MSRQRDADFDWLVLLDDRCPDDVRADVEDLAQGVFTPLWSREPFRRDSFAEAVASRTDAPWLITTRIDSDDAMAVDLMASVQAQFARQERLFISFTRGVQVDRSGAGCCACGRGTPVSSPSTWRPVPGGWWAPTSGPGTTAPPSPTACSRCSGVRPGALALAQALAAEGYGVVLVAARDPWVRLSPPTQLCRPQPAAPVTVLRRPNLGYDFGSWAAVLAAYPGLATKDTVLLVNDSLVGPFGPVGELVRRAEASTADVWGVTASRQVAPHLQSYWLAFRRGALATPELRRFFAGVRPLPAKTDVVLAYEVALGGLLATAGLRSEAAWRAEDLGVPGAANPVLTGWEALLGSGFPFVKRQLLQERRFRTLRPRVAAAVRRH